MTRYPRETVNGHDTTWTTATRPTNPNHGTMGFNETTSQIEIYNAIGGYWVTTTDVTEIYPA